MATKSIMKTIDVKRSDSVKGLVRAMENAENKTAKNVEYDKKCRTLSKEEIKKVFGDSE